MDALTSLIKWMWKSVCRACKCICRSSCISSCDGTDVK